MEQNSVVRFRAEKEYKSSRGGFHYLIREVVSNSIHAVLIKKKSHSEDTDFNPNVSIEIQLHEKSASLVVKDNGDGFNEYNRKYFTHLDDRNPEKERMKFHPQGQGRLSIIYFSDYAKYISVYQDDLNRLKKKVFLYPEDKMPLFDIEKLEGDDTDESHTSTELHLTISKQATFNRAKTFFNKYSGIEHLNDWFIDSFFPFFIENDNLSLTVSLNGESRKITKGYIENNVTIIPFLVRMEEEKEYNFRLWLVKDESKTPKIQKFYNLFCETSSG